MGFFFGCCNAGGSSGGASLGSRLAYASPAGGAVAATPPITASTGRLEVTLPSGNATWVSLTAGGIDGQLLEIRNNDSANTLILPKAEWGGVGDLNLPPGNAVLTYWEATADLWQVTS